VKRSSGRRAAVQTIVERPSALDVHKAQVTACARVPGEGGRREQHIAEFAATVRGLLELRDWLAGHGVTQVVMEATGVYWKAPWAILEDEFDCMLVNARHVKQVPGRKTDVSDAAWLCQLAEAGLLKANFVPPKPIRQLRNLTRYRKRRSRSAPVRSTACTRRSKTRASSSTPSPRTSWASPGATCSTRWSPARPTRTCSPNWRGGRCARRSPPCARRSPDTSTRITGCGSARSCATSISSTSRSNSSPA